MATYSELDYLDLHPFVRATAHDKLLGCIFGGALGDCIGLYTGLGHAKVSNNEYTNTHQNSYQRLRVKSSTLTGASASWSP